MRVALALLAAAALVGGSAMPALASPPRADRVVAAAWTAGGFPLPLNPNYRTVHFRLYADGRLVTPNGADVHEVPAYRVAQLPSSGARALRQDLHRATSNVDFGFVPVADVGYTYVRVAHDGRTAYTSINALTMTYGLTRSQREARKRLSALIDSTADISGRAFQPESYEVRRIAADDPTIQLEWTGPDLPATSCGLIAADAYADFPATYRQGNSYTWRGEAFTLWLRPLLPGETGCRGL